jgi:hypothetical protein
MFAYQLKMRLVEIFSYVDGYVYILRVYIASNKICGTQWCTVQIRVYTLLQIA